MNKSISDQAPIRPTTQAPDFTPEKGRKSALTRSLIVVPFLKRDGSVNRQEHVKEIVGLAEAIELHIIFISELDLVSPKPSHLLGRGKVEELSNIISDLDCELVIIDHDLSPVQQRNLERSWQVKVIDRTGLILEIFGRRARTKEGRLQVDLAHLNYQKSRLVRSWTHLERQRGGGGFMGGPGETQIEADRRLLQSRILSLSKQLEKVKKRAPYIANPVTKPLFQ